MWAADVSGDGNGGIGGTKTKVSSIFVDSSESLSTVLGSDNTKNDQIGTVNNNNSSSKKNDPSVEKVPDDKGGGIGVMKTLNVSSTTVSSESSVHHNSAGAALAQTPKLLSGNGFKVCSRERDFYFAFIFT